MIIEEIKKANIEALKAKDSVARTFYGVLLNKALVDSISKGQERGANSDADMVQILQKTIKELTEEEENYKKVNNAEAVAGVAVQKALAEKFLPQMMSKEEIKKEINSLSDKGIPNVMKHFKANFAGKVDMRDVQEALKNL